MLAILATLLPSLTAILNRIIPDPVEQAKAQQEIIKAITDNEAAIMSAMADVMKSDAASESWMTRNARPTVVYWGLTMISLWFVLSLFGFGPELTNAFKGVPSQLWDLVTYGIGAYILGKSGVDMAKVLKK